MTPEIAVDIFRDALFLIVLIVCVIVLPSLLVGLVVSVFQAATQINEQTLSFLPRLIVTLLMVVFAGPWMLQRLMDYTNRLFMDIPGLIG